MNYFLSRTGVFIDDSRKNTDAAKALGFQVLTVGTNEPWMPKLRQLLGQ